MNHLINAALTLRQALDGLTFSPPVTHTYNPLTYAWAAHESYLRRFGADPRKVLFLGMNPGPFGMMQTGVPFGEINAVRDWLKIDVPIQKPEREHPKRPIEGFACTRSEVSGKRLWGLFASRFPNPADFFGDHFVANYCPLVFLEESGRNRTPDKIPSSELAPVTAACDQHLRQLVDCLQPEFIVGVGAYAANRASKLFNNRDIHRILHPSPASPAANRDWAGTATRQLQEQGIWTS